MAEDTQLTPLNFNDAIIGKSINDRKAGLDIIFGYISGMPPDLAEYSENYGDLGMALMDRGMGQHELDLACRQLAGQLLNENFPLLITKSDLPFDARWYLIGNLKALIEAAAAERVTLPFNAYLIDDVTAFLDQYGI